MGAWLETLLDAEQMRAVDSWAIKQRGVPSLELMETAGRGLAEHAARLAAEHGVERIGVVCGRGNNGGDGLVAARHLDRIGLATEVAVLPPRDRLSPDALANLDRLPTSVSLILEAGPADVAEMVGRCGLIIDAMLGTGFAGEPREPVAGVIRALNASGRILVAADIASGVDASTGKVAVAGEAGRGEPLAVRADVTVTFHAAKLGHQIAPGKAHTGELFVEDIGIPEGWRQVASAESGRGEGGAIAGRILPEALDCLARRGAASTKFSSGQVVVVGGSRGLTGAPCMSAQAAIRSGAGYATVVVPGDLEPIFETKLTEVMSVGCPGPPGRLGRESVETAVAACERAAAVVLGPGLGREPETLGFAAAAATRIAAPLVIDADGLAAFGAAGTDNADAGAPGTHATSHGHRGGGGAGLEALGAARRAPTVLTPHAGELARLLGLSSAEIAARRLGAAVEAANRSRAIVVLKGDDTIVTDGSRVAVNALAAPALATAGTGDVLAGLIAALIARSDDPFRAVCAAVFAHARAGQLAAERVGLTESVIASDVIAALPEGLRR